jgi:multimeric flavodoxin WrbA/protein-tyrosine-phosphatase
MRVLGLQGSPRKNGNNDYLLQRFMEAAEGHGALTRTLWVDRMDIRPCKEFTTCEKKGFCPIDDAMKQEVYALIREADVIVAATPIFFYNMTAQLKALVDRCQTLWSRKYMLKLKDPGCRIRQGYLLSTAASKGKNLFEGLHLTTHYFYDAVDARYVGSLTYREIEGKGEMAAHPTVAADVAAAVAALLKPLERRRRVLFTCRENACRSQMAAGFAQYLAGDKLEVLYGGSSPAEAVNPLMVEAMAEKGIDMYFRRTRSIDDALAEGPPGVIVTMGCEENCPFAPGAERVEWQLPDPAGAPLETMRRVRDEIERRVGELAARLT